MDIYVYILPYIYIYIFKWEASLHACIHPLSSNHPRLHPSFVIQPLINPPQPSRDRGGSRESEAETRLGGSVQNNPCPFGHERAECERRTHPSLVLQSYIQPTSHHHSSSFKSSTEQCLTCHCRKSPLWPMDPKSQILRGT